MASVEGGLETPLPRALRPHSDDEGEDEFDPLDIFHSAFVRALSLPPTFSLLSVPSANFRTRRRQTLPYL